MEAEGSESCSLLQKRGKTLQGTWVKLQERNGGESLLQALAEIRRYLGVIPKGCQWLVSSDRWAVS